MVDSLTDLDTRAKQALAFSYDTNGLSTNPKQLDPVNDAVTNYPLGHNDTVISTATTTTIKTGAGTIRQIRVIGGTLGNVTAYDNTAGSGTLLVPTVTPAAGQILLEDAAFTTGLTIVTAAATLLAVTWR